MSTVLMKKYDLIIYNVGNYDVDITVALVNDVITGFGYCNAYRSCVEKFEQMFTIVNAICL
jgi:hypothetical protein